MEIRVGIYNSDSILLMFNSFNYLFFEANALNCYFWEHYFHHPMIDFPFNEDLEFLYNSWMKNSGCLFSICVGYSIFNQYQFFGRDSLTPLRRYVGDGILMVVNNIRRMSRNENSFPWLSIQVK